MHDASNITDTTMPIPDRNTAAVVTRPVPSVTACIVTHNRPHYVRSCLESLRQQTVGPDGFDIIVVDSCSRADVNAELGKLVADVPNAQLLRIDRPGASAARNLGAAASRADFLAYIDDDGLAMPDWIEQIQQVLMEQSAWPGVIGGRVLPVWEAPLPAWWPASLRGVLSIIEWEGQGEFRTSAVPPGLEPYGVNMIVQRQPLLEIGGFAEKLGRFGGLLLSDEDVQVGWRLQDKGYSAWYDSRVLVRHQIQAVRMRPEWLLERLYWQGASAVATRRILGAPDKVWRELPRRLVVELLDSAGILAAEAKHDVARPPLAPGLCPRLHAHGADGRASQAHAATTTLARHAEDGWSAGHSHARHQQPGA